MCLTQRGVLTQNSQCAVLLIGQTAKTPLTAPSHVCTYSTKTSPWSKTERYPKLFHPLQSSVWAWGSPDAGRETEAKWVKVKHLSLAVMCLSLSERARLQFFYIVMSCSSSLSVIPNNSRLRTSEGQGGHDLAFSCPKAGILSIKRPLQAPCSCPTSSSHHHGWR